MRTNPWVLEPQQNSCQSLGPRIAQSLGSSSGVKSLTLTAVSLCSTSSPRPGAPPTPCVRSQPSPRHLCLPFWTATPPCSATLCAIILGSHFSSGRRGPLEGLCQLLDFWVCQLWDPVTHLPVCPLSSHTGTVGCVPSWRLLWGPHSTLCSHSVRPQKATFSPLPPPTIKPSVFGSCLQVTPSLIRPRFHPSLFLQTAVTLHHRLPCDMYILPRPCWACLTPQSGLWASWSPHLTPLSRCPSRAHSAFNTGSTEGVFVELISFNSVFNWIRQGMSQACLYN